jgi:hypothetical protein
VGVCNREKEKEVPLPTQDGRDDAGCSRRCRYYCSSSLSLYFPPVADLHYALKRWPWVPQDTLVLIEHGKIKLPVEKTRRFNFGKNSNIPLKLALFPDLPFAI